MTHRILRSLMLAVVAASCGFGCRSTLFILADELTGAVNGEPFVESGPVESGPVELGVTDAGASSRRTTVSLESSAYPMVRAYTALSARLRVVSLCDCPTPVHELVHLEHEVGTDAQLQLYVKQDGVSNSALVGGNKLRKLELLMAQALHSDDSEMLISGSVGSNSVVATALVAKRLGLTPELHLVPQIPSERVTTNLLVLSRILRLPLGEASELGSQSVGTIHYHASSSAAHGAVVSRLARAAVFGDELPFVCPPGATSPLTTIAYVNAMHELAADVEAGRLPAAPRRIYVPTGSGGTFIGLLIGARTIPLFEDTDIIAVTSGSNRPTEQYHHHLQEVSAYLADLTNGALTVPDISLRELDAMLDRDSSGAYGEITQKGMDAKTLAVADDLHLEHTYTAKTVARMLDDARQAEHAAGAPPEVWLYWHTHNAGGKLYSELADPAIQADDLRVLRSGFTDSELATYGLEP